MSINESSDSDSILDSYHSFLQSLIGEEVQVYKGGPEAKKGRLLDVQSDYISLLAQNNMVIYYRTEHLKSIGENSKSISMPQLQGQEDENVFFHSEGDFFQLGEKLVGSYLQINQGGPESKTGKLLNISGNYLALLTNDDGVVYFNIHHIKSISGINNQNENFAFQGEASPDLDFIVAEDFHQLFSEMSHKWVSINRGGPEALEGVLVQTIGNHYTLINNDEVLRINPYHIKSISYGPKGSMKKYYESQQKENNQDLNEDLNQDLNQDLNEDINEDINEDLNQDGGANEQITENSSSNISGDTTITNDSSIQESSSSFQESSSSFQESSSSSRRSSSSKRRRSSSRRRDKSSKSRSSHDIILKTLDYIWKPRR